jgi:hypothetical protein
MLRVAGLAILVCILCGCALVNRYYGNFYGVARTGAFADSQGKQKTGVLFYVQRAGKFKVIGHDNKYLPLTNFSAVLITRRARLVSPEKVPLNREFMVRGLVCTDTVKSKTGQEDLLQSGTTVNDFHPVLRVKKIYRAE